MLVESPPPKRQKNRSPQKSGSGSVFDDELIFQTALQASPVNPRKRGQKNDVLQAREGEAEAQAKTKGKKKKQGEKSTPAKKPAAVPPADTPEQLRKAV